MIEMIAVVQAYINHRTGKTVHIVVSNGSDILLLNKAYNFAINWFKNNNGTIQ